MNLRIEKHKGYNAFGIERRFKNEESALIPAFWDEIHNNGEEARLLKAAGLDVSAEKGIMRLKGICSVSEPEDDSFRYMIGLEVTEGSDLRSYSTNEIPEMTWAIFRSDPILSYGDAITGLFSLAYSEWLPASGYDKAIGPDLEVYGAEGNGELYEEVWIPVKEA